MAGIAAMVLGGLGLFTRVAPLVENLVVDVEHIFGHGNGAQKKQAVVQGVSDAVNVYNASTGNNQSTSGLVEAIDAMVEAAWAFAQAEGKLLPHAAPAQPPAPAPAS